MTTEELRELSTAQLLEALAERERPLLVCTIYEGDLPATRARAAKTALRMYNDAIVSAAQAVDADILDLRRVCAEPADFEAAIEPSATGGVKVAAAVAAVALAPSHEGVRLWGAPARR